MKYKPLLIYLIISSIFLALIISIWKIMATLQGLKLTEINFTTPVTGLFNTVLLRLSEYF